MRTVFFIIILFLLTYLKSISQDKIIKNPSNISVNNLTNLSYININTSQHTNESIIQSNNKIFISSIDGLNISNGITTKVYKQSSHNMIGNIIQGNFHKDIEGYIWFTTYNALHKFLPEKDSFEVFKFTNSKEDTVTTDYRLIKHISENKILIKLKDELISFDTKQKRIIEYYKIDLFKYSKIDADLSTKNQVFVAGNNYGLKVILNKSSGYEINEIKNLQVESLLLENNNIWVGTITGSLLCFDSKYRKKLFHVKLSNTRIMDIQNLDNNRLLVTSKEQIFLFDKNSKSISKSFSIKNTTTGKNLKQLIKPYIDKDSILWIGNEGLGVFNINMKKKVFKHWKNLAKDGKNFRATKILENKVDTSYYICSYSHGLSMVNSKGKLVKEFGNNSSFSTGFKNSIWVDSTSILLSNYYSLNNFNTQTQTFQYLPFPFKVFHQIKHDNYNDIYSSVNKNFLVKLNHNKNNWTYDTIAICPPSISNATYLYFFFDDDNKLYVDNNLEHILVFDSTHNKFINKINLSGGIYSLVDISKNKIIISNINGLFEIDKDNFSYRQIIDDNQKLNQQIYGILIDKKGYYWLSTNKGIYRYNPKTNHAHQFKPKDGLQSKEFNTFSYFKNSKGELIFGGINGINIFNPLKVKLSKNQAKIDFYNYKINDVDSKDFGIGNYVKEIVLNHNNNTISFEFVGIDYIDPNSINLKYILEGKDKHWVEIHENKGFARYSNLRPGNYTFKMLASNADEVWSDQSKTVKLKVLPAWYQTWWFKILALFSIIGLAYYFFRSYHKRKMHEKDLQLQKQKLLLEKQQALEAERTRIAGEMHDDLGGGLTTIKFLSQKVLRKVEDEKQKSQIQKIVNHTQNLVTNMSEIIWAMNSGFDTLDSLIAYTRRYAHEYLLEHELNLNFNIKGKTIDIHLSGEKRRHIFLVIKEAMHNIVKHAEASEVIISFSVNDQLNILIRDNGKGINDENVLGNGLKNMKNRVEKTDGKIKFQTELGTIISIVLPL